jgi:FlaA1/EpsC-like NDP-sugar epimerase
LTPWKESRINYRVAIQGIWDASGWAIALLVATFLRYDGNPAAQTVTNAMVIGVILGLTQVILGWAVQRIRGRRIIGSFDEISVLTFTAAAVTLFGTIFVVLITPAPIPRSVPFIAGAIALTFMLGGRFTLRAYRQRSIFSQENERVLIYGAGESGDQIIRQMLATPSAKFTPVALIDDNPKKMNLRVHGIRVIGTSAELELMTRKTGATTLVVAIAGIGSKQLLEIDRRCKAINVDLRVIPTTSEIIGGAVPPKKTAQRVCKAKVPFVKIN